ncbi:MAG: DUF2169 domain-containing protein [Aquabacterium sp.]|uniref:DUF2169 family type VI secretion system accessory protein n=1 Tax=Aquabacterium sp. TaxID=1872578 RepID=UPI0025C0456B|nr:DUF2169 domain-containing protein [Aquabacterium sp.]MBI5924538.1 DUF2169 domain-containing protein [Aquabacterium sp.]
MEFINSTRMVAGYNMGLEPSGRELLVVVVKGTFILPKPGEQVSLAEKQWPLVLADTFTAKPGLSAPLHEIDFAPRKRACDVLLTGHACAPQGQALQRMRVGLRVGSMEKVFDVIGDRVWQAGLSGISASTPQPFSRMPISYDRAFGGADRLSEDEREHDAFVPNPVGRGWHKHLKNAWVDGTPLPNTEEVGQPVKFPSDTLRPMALGPLGRGWPQRARYAGTYDQAWLDHDFPFLPKDFDERYYQAAPEDQQMPLPQGPMEAVLSGFTPDGLRHFMLPYLELPVQVWPKRGDRESHVARLDTIAFEPDNERFTMTWRMARPLRASLHELAQTEAGCKGRAWWQQREQVAIVEPAPAASEGGV